MGENTEIEWCHSTFNPWWGCTKVSAGCAQCYALDVAKRFGGDYWGPTAERKMMSDNYWKQPLKWNREAEKDGERRRVFCASMADVFEDRPEIVEQRIRLFKLIMNTPHLDWLLLTKRPENILPMLQECLEIARDHGSEHSFMLDLAWWIDGWIVGKLPDNLWVGTSVENQEMADQRIPELLKVPAKVRFLSVEPLLGRIDLNFDLGELHDWHCPDCDSENIDPQAYTPADDFAQFECYDCKRIGDPGEDANWKPLIDWVIVGGESGPNARPVHPDWIRSIRDQCVDANIPFLFKQWGEWLPFYDRDRDDPDWRNVPDMSAKVTRISLAGGSGFHGDRVVYCKKVGKKSAGRLLDGREWNEYPEV